MLIQTFFIKFWPEGQNFESKYQGKVFFNLIIVASNKVYFLESSE